MGAYVLLLNHVETRRVFARLIENMIVLHDVNPNRIYVLGYSAGGDGVYQIPRAWRTAGRRQR